MNHDELKREIERLANERPGMYLSEVADLLDESVFDILDAANELLDEGKILRGE